jgi:DNA primase
MDALPWPRVAAPVHWDAVEQAAAEGRSEPLTFLADDVLPRIESDGDLFRPLLEREPELPG